MSSSQPTFPESWHAAGRRRVLPVVKNRFDADDAAQKGALKFLAWMREHGHSDPLPHYALYLICCTQCARDLVRRRHPGRYRSIDAGDCGVLANLPSLDLKILVRQLRPHLRTFFRRYPRNRLGRALLDAARRDGCQSLVEYFVYLDSLLNSRSRTATGRDDLLRALAAALGLKPNALASSMNRLRKKWQTLTNDLKATCETPTRPTAPPLNHAFGKPLRPPLAPKPKSAKLSPEEGPPPTTAKSER